MPNDSRRGAANYGMSTSLPRTCPPTAEAQGPGSFGEGASLLNAEAKFPVGSETGRYRRPSVKQADRGNSCAALDSLLGTVVTALP